MTHHAAAYHPASLPRPPPPLVPIADAAEGEACEEGSFASTARLGELETRLVRCVSGLKALKGQVAPMRECLDSTQGVVRELQVRLGADGGGGRALHPALLLLQGAWLQMPKRSTWRRQKCCCCRT